MRRRDCLAGLTLLCLTAADAAITGRGQVSLVASGPQDDVALILTCHISDETKQAMYERVVRWWLEHTSYHLVVVDSANAGLPALERETKYADRLRVTKFDQAAEIANHGYDSDPSTPTFNSSCERLELQMALRACPDLNSKRLIVKITGKYALPTLEAELAALPADSQIVLQQPNSITNQVGPGSQNSELFGFSPDAMRGLISNIPTSLASRPDARMETYLGEWVKLLRDINFIQPRYLPPLPIPEDMRYARADSPDDILANLEQMQAHGRRVL